MPKPTRKTFTVEGFGSFPIDMLRHDACWPASSEDASNIEGMGHRRKVRLATDWFAAPTTGRWNSFLWSIVEED